MSVLTHSLSPHQLQEGHEKVAEQISRDVSQLCSQLATLWSRFLDAAVLNPHILSYLAQEHHTLRVRAAVDALVSSEALLRNPTDVCLLPLEFLLSFQSKEGAFKFSQRQQPTRRYKNTTSEQHGFITVGNLFLPASP